MFSSSADLQTANDDWHTAFVSHLSIQNAAKAATAAKNDERDDSEGLARQLARILQANPAMTDAARGQAGLTIPDEEPTPLGPDTVEQTPPPLLSLDWSQRQRVTIHFGPNPANERENALPAGMRGVKLWYALGGIPASEDDWRYLVDDTRSPYVHVLTISEPTTVAYRAQYFDRKMRPGPFSDPAIATVTV